MIDWRQHVDSRSRDLPSILCRMRLWIPWAKAWPCPRDPPQRRGNQADVPSIVCCLTGMLQDRWPLIPGLEIRDLHMMALELAHMIPMIFGHWSTLLEVRFYDYVRLDDYTMMGLRVGSWSSAFRLGCKLWRFRMGISLNSLIRSLQWSLIHFLFQGNASEFKSDCHISWSIPGVGDKEVALLYEQPRESVAWLRRCVALN